MRSLDQPHDTDRGLAAAPPAAPTGLVIDPARAEPLFKQIADQIADRIERGLYPAHFRLPPSRALADELGTHRNTVVRAYETLAEQGWVRSEVGRGTFVEPGRALDLRPQPHTDALQPSAGLRWEALLSSAGRVEPLSRAERLPRHRLAPGADLIDLTRMQPSPDLLPSADLRRCLDHVLRAHGPGALGYAPREGLPRLRECIVDDLARLGVPARVEDVVVTTGSQQALDLIARALIDPGDAFAVESETYSGAIHLLSVAGARLAAIPADAEGPDLATLERLSAGLKGVYLMPNCRNPTGATISAERRHALVDLSRRTGVPLIEDDYGADLVLDASSRPPPALRALDRDVLYVSTFSKRLIPALRVGFVVCPPPLREALVTLKHTMDLGTSAILQHALAEFLERGYLRAHLRRTLPVYRARRDALQDALTRYLPREVRWSHIERGIVMWLELPPELRADEVFLEAQRAGVLVNPGALHTVSGRAQSGLRLTLCHEPEHRLVEGVRRLARAFDVVAHRNRHEHSVRPSVSAI